MYSIGYFTVITVIMWFSDLMVKNGKTALAPIYDFLKPSIAIKNPDEEITLTLKRKKVI